MNEAGNILIAKKLLVKLSDVLDEINLMSGVEAYEAKLLVVEAVKKLQLQMVKNQDCGKEPTK